MGEDLIDSHTVMNYAHGLTKQAARIEPLPLMFEMYIVGLRTRSCAQVFQLTVTFGLSLES